MHEYALTEQIITICEEYVVKNSAKSVTAIHLVVGESSGYMAESIKLYFDIIAKKSVCEKAEVLIENIKPMLKCASCGQLFERVPFSFTCTFCGGDGESTEIGREFYIKSIEIEA